MPIRVGDEVFIGDVRGRGGHGAYIIVNKVNQRSIKGIERERSYKPGTQWSIGAGATLALVGKSDAGLMTLSWGELGDSGAIK